MYCVRDACAASLCRLHSASVYSILCSRVLSIRSYCTVRSSPARSQCPPARAVRSTDPFSSRVLVARRSFETNSYLRPQPPPQPPPPTDARTYATARFRTAQLRTAPLINLIRTRRQHTRQDKTTAAAAAKCVASRCAALCSIRIGGRIDCLLTRQLGASRECTRISRLEQMRRAQSRDDESITDH